MRKAFAQKLIGPRTAVVILALGVALPWGAPSAAEDTLNVADKAGINTTELKRLPGAEAQLQEIADLNTKMRSLESAADRQLAATTARSAGVAKLAQSIDQMLSDRKSVV